MTPSNRPGAAAGLGTIDFPLEAQCRRIAAWSLALQRSIGQSRSAEIMDLAEALDAYFAWEPFQSAALEPDDMAGAALACLRVATREDLERAIRNLPVFPMAAQRALALLARDDWNAWELERVASSDQMLAANLIRAANSALTSTLQRIGTISQALVHIGAERASRVVYAAAMRPVFATPGMRDLWHHSLASAEVAQSLAKLSRAVDPQKAFLAGLVHDLGVLAMAIFPGEFRDLYQRLTRFGCEQILAERALAGVSHGEAGALALAAWKFPEEFVQAVGFHHSPERSDSVLASLLYLTEQWTDSAEDAPSAVRFRHALRRLNLSERQFEQMEPEQEPAVAGLRLAG